jgi:hypothetical protein
MELNAALAGPLRDWLNPAYLDPGVLFEARRAYRDQQPLASIQLRNFLTPRKASEAVRHIARAASRPIYIPDERSHFSLRMPGPLARLLAAPALQAFLGFLTTTKGVVRDASVKGYAHQSYTLLRDDAIEKPGVDLYWHVAPSWNPDWGGAAIYLGRDGRELLRVQPIHNALTLVQRPPGVRRFLQYVTHEAERDSFAAVEGRL